MKRTWHRAWYRGRTWQTDLLPSSTISILISYSRQSSPACSSIITAIISNPPPPPHQPFSSSPSTPSPLPSSPSTSSVILTNRLPPPRLYFTSLSFLRASLVAQLVQNPSAVWETWVQSLGWEDPLEKGMATHSQYAGLETSMDYTVHGVTKSQTRLSNFHFLLS